MGGCVLPMHTASGCTRYLLSVAYSNYGIPLSVCMTLLPFLTPKPRCGYALLPLSTAKFLGTLRVLSDTPHFHFVGTAWDWVWQPVVFYVSRPSHVISATIPGRCRPRNLLRSYVLLVQIEMYLRQSYQGEIFPGILVLSVRLFHLFLELGQIAAETTAGNKNAALLCPE